MIRPKLSIIIVTWNTADITLKCLHTIKKHLPLNKEIVIVDNGSTDKTLNRLKNYKNDIILVTNTHNKGFSKAANLGAARATGEYLFFLNSDIEITNDSIITMLHFIEKNQQVGIVGPKFLNPNLSPQGSVFPPQTLLNAFKEFWLKQKTFSKYTPSTSVPQEVWAISGGALMISHQLFDLVHGFDESYFMYFEDLDLCQKIKHLNRRVYYYPLSTVIHRHGASGRQLADSRNQWRRLISSSQHFHGFVKYFLLHIIIWSGQKWQKLIS